MCKMMIPEAHAASASHLSSNSLERNVAKEGLATVAAVATAVIG